MREFDLLFLFPIKEDKSATYGHYSDSSSATHLVSSSSESYYDAF